MNPLCKCGCGKEVNINRDSGEYSKFRQGHSNKYQEVKEKKRQTSLNHFGVENPSQSVQIKEKKRQTSLNHFGVENPNQSLEIKDKKRQTNINKYGGFTWQSKELSNKCKQTCIKKYGFEYAFQSKEIQEKYKKTCIDRYGVDHFTKTLKGKEISSKNFVRMIEEAKRNGEPIFPRIGDIERSFLNEIQKYIKHKIIRNESFVVKNINNKNNQIRFPDGYVLELKLFIQFDERHHFLDSDYKIHISDDFDCDLQLASLGYIIYRISKKEWEEDKEKVIVNFQNLISLLEVL